MAAVQTPKPPHQDWHQEGSSSGEWSPKRGPQPSDIILPLLHTAQTSQAYPQIHDTTSTVSTQNQPLESSSDKVNQDHKLVRVPQVPNTVTVSANQASSHTSKSPGTMGPYIDVKSTARGALNRLAVLPSSGSDRGDVLTSQHIEPVGLEKPTDLSQPNVQDLQIGSSSVDADSTQGLKLRKHAWGATQHVITSREVHEEPPTDELVLEQKSGSVVPFVTPPENLTSSTSPSAMSTEPSLSTQNPTTIPNNQTASNETTTVEEGRVVQGNGTDSAPHLLGNVTAVMVTNSSVESVGDPGNSSEPSSPATGNFLNMQVPATTEDPWTPDSSPGPTMVSPPPHMTICLSRLDIVWIVLAISVPVSSCCK